MSIRFIIGRAGSGKSQRCYEEVTERLKHSGQGTPLIMLVPEQATFQAEYALVNTPGLSGMIRGQVLSFRRLAFRVMQEVGGTANIHISETGKKMLLHKIIRRRKQDLRLFFHSVEQTGFVEQMHELFTELKRYNIDAAQLDGHAKAYQDSLLHSGMLPDKLHDLVLIYDEFEAELSRHYVDSEDYLSMLAEQAEKSAYLQEAEVWIDGFNGFTPQEFMVIEQLLKHCRRVNITLCNNKEYAAGEQPHELDLFHPTAVTMSKLQEIAGANGVPKEQSVLLSSRDVPAWRFADSPMLGHLEMYYGKQFPFVSVSDQAPDIVIQSAVHRRAEVEGTAREMIRLARDEHYRWRDMAIVVRNAETYQELIANILNDYGVPYFFDQKRSILHHPLVELIRSALEVVRGHFRHEAVFRCIKTDFFLPFPDPEEREEETKQAQSRNAWRISERMRMDELENYCLAFGIQGSKWTQSGRWEYKLQNTLEGDLTEATAREQLRLDRIHESRMRVAEPLSIFQKLFRKAANVREMTEALFGLLENLQVSRRLAWWSEECLENGEVEKAKEHEGVWASVLEILDQLVEMMGDEVLSADFFAETLDAGLENMKLGLVPPTLDQVLIGNMERTRSSQIKAVFILGVNDGVLPARMKEGSILSEQERDLMISSGIHIAPGSLRKLLDEQFLIYSALTAPSHRLWLSYPLADEEGKSLLPSDVIRHIKVMFPQLESGFLLGEPPAERESEEFGCDRQLEFIAHPEQALSYLMQKLRQWKRGVPIADIWWNVYNWYCSRPEWHVKLGGMMAALFEINQERPLSTAISRQLYGQELKASVSRMEKFVACPFAHFASHGLRLQERRIYRLAAPDIGQLFHAALSAIAAELQQAKISWGSLTKEQCLLRASEAVDRLSPRLQGEILLSSKRYQYISRKLKEIVGRASVIQSEHARRSGFSPIGLEVDFGVGKSLPPLTFTLNNGCIMQIIGRIDRIDQAESSYGVLLRIIDYKSSQTLLNMAEVFYGLSLQMLTYLDVVIAHAEDWLGISAKPAGVLYFHVHNPLLNYSHAISAEQAEEELFKRFKMKGLLLADQETVRLMDSSLETGHSQIVPVQIKKDGTFASRSSCMDESQWASLRGHVRAIIQQIGHSITDGEVSINPYRMGKKTACMFCAFRPVCQFDPLFAGNEYRTLPILSKDEVWKRMNTAEYGGAKA